MSRWNYIKSYYLNNNTFICEVLTENDTQDYIYINHDKMGFNSMLNNTFYQYLNSYCII